MTEQASTIDFSHLAEDVEDLSSVFNLSDVATEVAPGKGWSCGADPTSGIKITIDPSQLAQPSGEVKEDDVLFVTRHELQHTGDMLDPEWEYQPDISKLSETDKLFWNGVHDVTIDGRTVNDYKGYRETAPDLYETLVKDTDMRKAPKHIQMMMGLRFQSVLGDKSPLKIDPEVQKVIDGLRDHDGHDLAEVLIHKGTTLRQRIALAEKFIKPEYDKLVEEERQNRSEEEMEEEAGDANRQSDMTQSTNNGSSSDNQGKGSNTFEEQLEEAAEKYKAYEPEDEGEEGESDEEADDEGDEEGAPQEDATNGRNDKGNLFSNLGKKVMHAVEDIRDSISSEQEDNSPRGQKESVEEMIGRLGGTVESELGLRGPDAEAYARALVLRRPLIEETAEIFQRLATIDMVQSRMRHTRQALPDGEKLHTGRLPEAFIQAEMDIPMEIWRGKKRQAPKVIRQFNGLDVWLHIDSSKSMNGAPALHAAEMSLVLVEGLLLARRYQAKEIQNKQPDVRVASMIFAGSTETIMPLSHEPSGQDRARMFINTKKADNSDTLVCPGLRTITDEARKNPERDIIGIVISDNMFGDSPTGIVRSKPDNCLIWNFSLGGSDSLGVGKYAANVNRTSQLPPSLLNILRYYERQFYA